MLGEGSQRGNKWGNLGGITMLIVKKYHTEAVRAVSYTHLTLPTKLEV